MAIRSVGVLLAAGAGTRFAPNRPGAKLESIVDGVAIGKRAFLAISEATDAMIVAVRSTDDELARTAAQSGALVLVPPRFEEGMGYSLAAAVKLAIAKFAEAETLVVGLGDMPWIRESTVRTIVDTALTDRAITQPRFAGDPGHPVAFPRGHWSALARCEGDVGARQLLAEYQANILYIDVDDVGVLRDVDRPEDLSAS
jgi:molybdenum cofactor cytidylyltransferase